MVETKDQWKLKSFENDIENKARTKAKNEIYQAAC